MSLYERFKDSKEDGFRNEFIKPLLVRMGFYGITQLHGSQEFGKDFVFSELDRFGHYRHMVVQAKHEAKIDQGQITTTVISQIKQAFNVPYTVPSSPSEQRYVSAVYVFNTGKITDNAVATIRHSLAREHASNTFFLEESNLTHSPVA